MNVLQWQTAKFTYTKVKHNAKQSLRATLIVAILQVLDGNGILVTPNYGQIQNACMEYK